MKKGKDKGKGGGRQRKKVLCAQMISMRGPRLGSGPQRWRSCVLADDGVAQMGSSLAPSSLLCMDPAL